MLLLIVTDYECSLPTPMVTDFIKICKISPLHDRKGLYWHSNKNI